MKTLVIKINNDSTLKLLAALAKELGLTVEVLTDKKKEDIALMRAIDEGMRGKKLSVDSVYRILDNLSK